MSKHAALSADDAPLMLPRVLVPHPHVRCDVRTLNGSPYVAGSKVPVRRLWSWHRSGVPIDKLMKRYPQLGPAKVLDALAFAYDNRVVVEADLERELQALERAKQTRSDERRPIRQQAFFFMDEPKKA
jgi:uncharacterized protein (DUF433 family)